MVTRRRVLRTGLTTAAAVSGTTAGLWPLLGAQPVDAAEGGGRQGGADGSGPDHGGMTDDATPALFDEVYRGRRIRGMSSPEPAGVRILIDGRPLGLMRRVDGSWISMANHYQPYMTPLATARGAVDVIGKAELSTAAMHHH